jgi:hypothetical protein
MVLTISPMTWKFKTCNLDCLSNLPSNVLDDPHGALPIYHASPIMIIHSYIVIPSWYHTMCHNPMPVVTIVTSGFWPSPSKFFESFEVPLVGVCYDQVGISLHTHFHWLLVFYEWYDYIATIQNSFNITRCWILTLHLYGIQDTWMYFNTMYKF